MELQLLSSCLKHVLTRLAPSAEVLSMGVGHRLVLIPSPFAEGTFGCWLQRCAQAYHTTARGFANAPLAGIDVRICAGYMASAPWHAYMDSEWFSPYRGFVTEAMRVTLARASYMTNPLVGVLQRSPRKDQERWTTVFS